MSDFTVKFNADERQELVRIVTRELEDTRVEVHHTHTPGFRDEVLQEEKLLRGMLSKLNAKVAAPA